MDDFRRIFYGVLIGFVLMLVLWISFLTFSGAHLYPYACSGHIAASESLVGRRRTRWIDLRYAGGLNASRVRSSQTVESGRSWPSR